MQTASLSHTRLITAAIEEMRRQRMDRIEDSLVIVEAESMKGLSQTHTQDQWWAFFREASRIGG